MLLYFRTIKAKQPIKNEKTNDPPNEKGNLMNKKTEIATINI